MIFRDVVNRELPVFLEVFSLLIRTQAAPSYSSEWNWRSARQWNRAKSTVI